MSGPPHDEIEAARSRDRRFAAIDLGLQVEIGLRDNRPLQILMERLRADADVAMRDFSTANPADFAAIGGLQARVFRFMYIFDTMNAILAAGQNAEREVRLEDQADHATNGYPDDTPY